MANTAIASSRRKQNVSVTLEPALVRQAKAAGINLSRTLDSALRGELKQIEAARWQRDNAEALEYLDKRAEEDGLLSDEYRTF
ncbi:MAG TPA: type II toxin-antitoxin system CcdA family antitoxin [Enterobacteriaceae bacterium]|nr:type II toxin-antitoxin system CcdA family antitoxin [Enterobacteriaceae bacterium]